MTSARALLLAVTAGLALADASIVTLALPPVIDELDTSIEGAAAVLGVYTAVLAATTWVIRKAAHTRSDFVSPRVGAVALAVFAAATAGAGAAGSIELLVVLRGVQASAAGVALVALFGALGSHRHWWRLAATLGIATGPALGGLLTELLDWRAIFYAQAPVLAVAAVARWARGAGAGAGATPAAAATDTPPAAAASARLLLALGLVAAALTAVLFLLVVLLVSGWSLSPLEAAITVSLLPLAAVTADRAPGGTDVTRAALGAALIGSGTLVLVSLPGDEMLWVVLAQLAAGAGMGLALPALHGRLLPERTQREAARLLTVRHLAITLALALLAPIASAQVDDAVESAREQGAALVLDARLPLLQKVTFAGALVADLDPVDPRGQLRESLDANADQFDGEERAAYAELRRRAAETLVSAVDGALRIVFAITAVLALVAAALLRPHPLLLATLVLPAVLVLVRPGLAPEPVRIADPCRPRELPQTGGVGGALQDAALVALDRAACRFGSSREELAIALADGDAADEYEREYGVRPSSTDLLRGIVGF